ncbi:MAG: DUF4136 domain-containing protein [Vitreoscilla sp.]|nr:DUF4136 domain-containing protein [Vitreoscilla sp.]
MRPTAWIPAALLAAGLMAGCAGFKTVTSEVSTYGDWPAGRAAGSYAIERLPSQQAAKSDEQQMIEGSASLALQAAGFVPAAAGTQPDVVVQIGARVTRQERAPWDDPLWWNPRFSRWAVVGWPGPYWATRMRLDTPEYQREVGVLIRDRATGQPLYEARARNDGITSGGQTMLTAMFTAALKEFPKVQNESHDVDVILP